MDFVFKRSYRGPVKMVIFDWAGTTVDYGCYAPAVVFVEVFKRYGVEITMEQARAPMGLQKNEHIRAISRLEEVDAAWRERHGRACSDAPSTWPTLRWPTARSSAAVWPNRT